MSWQNILGHDALIESFRTAVARGRLASTFLFVGPPGIGKRAFALQLAQALLCERRPESALDPCGECPACRQVQAGSHPDVQVVSRPADKSFLPLDLLIGDAEHRLRAGLCYELALKPYSGRRKIAIIDDADYLNKEGANCLLKTLEEPPPRSVLILIGTSEQRQLPTIRSRCQIVRFQPLPADHVAALLLAQGHCTAPDVARRAASQSGGSLTRALHWCDDRVSEFRGQLLALLSQRDVPPLEAAKTVLQFVDEAGSDTAAKRQRLRLVVSLAEEYYRALVRALAAATLSDDSELATAVSAATGWFHSEEAAAACLERCLDAAAHIDANAQPVAIVEWWLDELAAASRTPRVLV